MIDAEIFLTIAEVKRLTGRSYAPAQKRVLDKRKIAYDQDDAGRPIVLRAAIERRQLGKAISREPSRGPDFSAFPSVS